MDSYIEITPDTTPKYVDPFPGRSGDELEWDPCGRCGGTGNVYTSVDGGRCWECMGSKGAEVPIRKLRARESGRLSALRAAHKKWVARAERHNANVAAVVAVDEAGTDWHEAMDTDAFLLDLWSKAFDYELSAKQVAAVASSLRRRADRASAKAAEAEAAPVPEGRYELEGEIASVKAQEGDYGTTWKMLVTHETGYKVWITIPGSVLDANDAEGEEGWRPVDALKGRRVRMTATVEASRDDRAFGFGKRPTKAVLLPAA
ncbi:hypothetical protein SEA_BOLT007_78 [Arthrobacter phage Bolt007]|uniref:Uncharacterized protein n=1 Tax=Arthrobacter phage Bolt007 TaxID=3017297 RepID=A0AA49I8F3_9CAUD|nr:hypothetical protein SEA_BOLT007_78 [Arthrobacter phage Bolt007]